MTFSGASTSSRWKQNITQITNTTPHASKSRRNDNKRIHIHPQTCNRRHNRMMQTERKMKGISGIEANDLSVGSEDENKQEKKKPATITKGKGQENEREVRKGMLDTRNRILEL
jgi:hypothetical protein